MRRAARIFPRRLRPRLAPRWRRPAPSGWTARGHGPRAGTDRGAALSHWRKGAVLSDVSGAARSIAAGERATPLPIVAGPAGAARCTVHLPAAGTAITCHGTRGDARRPSPLSGETDAWIC